MGIIEETTKGVIQDDARSLDYSLHANDTIPAASEQN